MGASHVTVACTDIDAAVDSLQRCGYHPDFVDRDVLNHPSKRGILQDWSDRHAISLLRSKGRFPIELVSYPVERSRSRGHYIGMFDAEGVVDMPDSELESVRQSIVTDGLSCKVGRLADLDLSVLVTAGREGEAGLKSLAVSVSDIGRSREFWCGGLGFHCERATSDIARVTLPSPVVAWRLAMTLVRSATEAAKPPLNADGMACLSFLSSNVEDDVSRLVAKGATVGAAPFQIAVNGKKMNVAIVAFDGAYIELLRILP